MIDHNLTWLALKAGEELVDLDQGWPTYALAPRDVSGGALQLGKYFKTVD